MCRALWEFLVQGFTWIGSQESCSKAYLGTSVKQRKSHVECLHSRVKLCVCFPACVWDPERVGHILIVPPSLSACLFWSVKDYFRMIIVACRPRSRWLASQISELVLGTSAHFAVFNLMSLASSSFFPPPPPLFPHPPLNSLVSNSNRLVCLDNRII